MFFGELRLMSSMSPGQLRTAFLHLSISNCWTLLPSTCRRCPGFRPRHRSTSLPGPNSLMLWRELKAWAPLEKKPFSISRRPDWKLPGTMLSGLLFTPCLCSSWTLAEWPVVVRLHAPRSVPGRLEVLACMVLWLSTAQTFFVGAR